MSLKRYSHTASYRFIDEALRARWSTFLALEREMAAFEPKPIEEFQAQREAEVERLRMLNLDSTVTELAVFVDRQFDFRASREWQFCERFDQRLKTEYITVIILSHALSEALINAILAIGLAHVGSVDLFPLLERADFKQKWLVGPKSFTPTYHFPKGTGMHETLTVLARQRNALVHQKIELRIGDTKVLEGSNLEPKSYEEEQRWLRRFFSLPYDLSQFASESILDLPQMLHSDRRPIEVAHEHGRI